MKRTDIRYSNRYYQKGLLLIYSSLVLLTYMNRLQAQCSPSCSGSSTSVGVGSGNISISALYNTSLFGYEAGKSLQFANNNSFFGRAAGTKTFGFNHPNQTFVGSHNSFFGSTSGFHNTFGYDNSFFGSYAGFSNTEGKWNCFFGREAGYSNDRGNSNSLFGSEAGQNISNSDGNSIFGRRAGWKISGEENSFFGSYAGQFMDIGSGNCFFGSGAGRYLEGDRNIAIGYSSGPNTQSSNNSNRLFIDNHQTNNPLIYGELDSHFVRINGSFEVTAGLSNPSSRKLKNNFRSVNKHAILDKFQELDIQQWTYKDRPDEPHIGPVAEEFYSAFGLGADDKHISTIDADGVMMLAIQALLDKVEKLEEEIMKLKSH